MYTLICHIHNFNAMCGIVLILINMSEAHDVAKARGCHGADVLFWAGLAFLIVAQTTSRWTDAVISYSGLWKVCSYVDTSTEEYCTDICKNFSPL